MSQLWQDAVAYASVLLNKPLPAWLSHDVTLHQEDGGGFVAITTSRARFEFLSQTILGPLTEGLQAATGSDDAKLSVACRQDAPPTPPAPPKTIDPAETDPTPGPLSDMLEQIVDNVRSQHPALYRRWFSELTPLALADGALRIRASTRAHANYLRQHGSDAFNGAARALTGRPVTVQFLDPAEHATPTPQPRADRSSTPNPPDTLTIHPDYSFDHFVLGPNNRLAHAAARAVADDPGRAYNPLFIHGGVGLGKTHLLQAVCLKVLADHPRSRLHYVSCEQFITQFVSAVQSGRAGEFRHAFRDVDLLVIDDVHCLAGRERTQEEFFHTFNSLYQAGRQIILSSDAAPSEIPDLEARLVSRFNWGLVCTLNRPDYETRVEIVKRKAAARGMDLPDAVAGEIARHVDSNVRELEGAVTKLQVAASLERKPISLAMARETLADSIPRPENAAPSIDQILAELTAYYGIRRADIISKRRSRSVTLPRQVGMYLARTMTRHSLEEIGAHFGGRDHTTVMHAVSSVTRLREDDPAFNDQILALLGKFSGTRKEPPAKPAPLSGAESEHRLGAIVDRTCETYGVSREDLRQSASPQAVAARNAVSWLARRHTSLSFPTIAHQLGRGSHSTVITAAKRAEAVAATDPKLLELQAFCSNAFEDEPRRQDEPPPRRPAPPIQSQSPHPPAPRPAS